MAKSQSRPAAVPPTLEPTPLTTLKANREILATSPSGNIYRIRPINLERHALAGGLPAKLRAIALKGSDALDEAIGWGAEDDEEGEADETKLEILKYLDSIVESIVVEPNLRGEDLDEVLPPVDYRWLLHVAMGETDEDGEGRRLWGREPLARWATFREFHGCSEDCDSCRRVRDFFSAALAGTGTV